MRAPLVRLLQDMSMRISEAELKRVVHLEECEKKSLRSTQSLLGPPSSGCVRLSPDIMGLFASRELAPVVLEHEKALLVIKEHDYAKAPERPDILQLSNIHEAHNISRSSLEAPFERESCVASPRKPYKDVLFNCRSDIARLREKVSHQDDSLVGTHFRNVVSVQVALIREQQEQLHEKDRELGAMRKEKEQLEARLERMERRMAILQKRSRGREDSEPAARNNTPTPKAHLSRRESLINSELLIRSRSSSLDQPRVRSRTASRPETPRQSEERDTPSGGKKGSKRKSRTVDVPDSQEAKRPRRKTPELPVIRTTVEYSGLDLPLSREPSSRRSSVVELAVNHCSVEAEKSDSTTVVVPTWRLCQVEAASTTAGDQSPEDVTEEGFLKRHKKLEEDEKRRKRWDIQRARTLREHEELLRKYSKKGQAKEKRNERVFTLLPKLLEIESIEIMDTITVSAFGAPLPVIKPSEFSLPDFDVDARDAKESVRTTRSMARAGRTSISSSGTEES